MLISDLAKSILYNAINDADNYSNIYESAGVIGALKIIDEVIEHVNYNYSEDMIDCRTLNLPAKEWAKWIGQVYERGQWAYIDVLLEDINEGTYE